MATSSKNAEPAKPEAAKIDAAAVERGPDPVTEALVTRLDAQERICVVLEGRIQAIEAESQPMTALKDTVAQAASAVGGILERVTALEASGHGDLGEFRERLAIVETQLGEVGRHMPRSIIPLTIDEVSQRIKSDRTAPFRVLVAYGKGGVSLTSGQQIVVQHYPDLLAHVQNGLQLVAGSR